MTAYPGLYLAKIVSAVDAEKRFRVQVRAYGVHARGLPDSDLPWAEYCSMTGFMRGDFFSYHTGDDVFVMFMGGDSDRPVVVGGRVSTANGVTDAPIPYQTDVTTSDSTADYKRWDRVDSAGNRVSLSEKSGELHVLLQSGGASVEVTQRANAIYLRASGAVVIQSPSATISAGTANVSAGTVNIDATSGDAEYRSSGGDTLLTASPITLTDTAGGDVNIGGEVPRLRGIPMPPSFTNTAPQQAGRTNIRSNVINIGAGTAGVAPVPTSNSEIQADFDGIVPVLPTTAINIRCIGPVAMHTTSTVDINGATSVNVQSALTATIQSGANSVTVTPVNTHVSGNLVVTGTVTAADVTTLGTLVPLTLPVTSLNLHTHTSTTPGNQTSVPTPGT